MQKIFLVNVLSLVRPELPTNIQKDSQHFKRNGGRKMCTWDKINRDITLDSLERLNAIGI